MGISVVRGVCAGMGRPSTGSGRTIYWFTYPFQPSRERGWVASPAASWIPAFAGMTGGMRERRGSSAGMGRPSTSSGRTIYWFTYPFQPSRERGWVASPAASWIPAFAGMTGGMRERRGSSAGTTGERAGTTGGEWREWPLGSRGSDGLRILGTRLADIWWYGGGGGVRLTHSIYT